MSTVIIDEANFDEDITKDIGLLFKQLHPFLRLRYIRKEGTIHTYTTSQEISVEDFIAYVQANHCACKTKREEESRTVNCKLIKLDGVYYIQEEDGTKVRVALV
jgi:hypothetical protein